MKSYYNFAIVGIDKNVDKGVKNSLSKNSDIFEDYNILLTQVSLTVSAF